MNISTNVKWRHALLAALLPALAFLSQPSLADSRDALFGDLDDTPKPKAAKPANDASGLKGFVQFELARTIDDPTHWSKLRTRGEIGTQGKLGSGMKWKANLRLDYDAVFDVNDHYPSAVAHNQRATAALRETYLDISAGDWDFRLGRQHVVWGEMVGLFFADVVSARDLREFILPEFDTLRTPQWAARAEYFLDEALDQPLRRLPFDRAGKKLLRGDRQLPHRLAGNQRRLRGLPRPGFPACGLGAGCQGAL